MLRPSTRGSSFTPRAKSAAGLLAFVLEGDLDLGPVRDRLAVFDLQVELLDLRDAEIAERAPGAQDRGGCRLLPRLRAGADQLDDFVHALGHGGPPLSTRRRIAAAYQLLRNFLGLQ